jgi:short-subunit dehydrogenase
MQNENKNIAVPNNLTWITGASSGIGLSLTLALANQGHKIIASARDESLLIDLSKSNPNIVPLPCDITDKVSVLSAASYIRKNFLKLDRIILNAGTCEYLDFPDPQWDAIRRVMEVNYFGTINCLESALPLLRASDSQPHVVVVASQVTFAPFPRAEAYGASKAALQYFFSSLQVDMAKENIDVTIVNPGFVDTPLTRLNDFKMPFLLDAEIAAMRIVEGLKKRPREITFPRRLKWLLKLSKVMPVTWGKLISKNASDKNSLPTKKGFNK